MSLRAWLTFGGLGVAAAFGYRDEWALTAVVAVIVLLPVAWWMAAMAVTLREHPEMIAGRHRKRRSLREVAMAALTAAARVPLP